MTSWISKKLFGTDALPNAYETKTIRLNNNQETFAAISWKNLVDLQSFLLLNLVQQPI